MKYLISIVFLSAILGVGAQSVQAKPLSRIIREIGLTPDDYEVMQTTVDQLFANGVPSVGRQLSWNNPDSGSKGTVKLRARRDSCVYLQHFVFPQGAPQSREIRTRWCQDANGTWLLTP